MSKYYRDYVWKEGIPYGINALDDTTGLAYKIAMDPYRKRIAIERYENKQFKGIIYDSGLLDFRHLKPAEQTAWQKVTLSEDNKKVTAAIYNQDDRLILIETYHFEDKFCRSCISTSGHGIVLSEQKIFYKSLGDHFNGVVLYDINEHPVTLKIYELDEQGEFSDLIEEIWDGKQIADRMERA
jgi:hypothetical protein